MDRYAMQHAGTDLCGMLHPSTYDDAVYVNAVVEINMIDQRRHGI